MKEIKRYLDNRIGEYSFYFEDLHSGYIYAHNENVKMTSAGCMKLPLAIVLLKQVENGIINLNEKVKVCGVDMVYGSGIIHEFEEREYSLFELMVAMLIQSDNTAANKIIDIIGMDKINQELKSLGLSNTILNRKTMDERAGKGRVENISSSMDLSKCWKILYNKSYLNEKNSKMLLDILRRQQNKNKIAFYMPDDIKMNMASKSGDLDGVENDTAFFQIPKGDFIFTVMSNNLPNNVYGTVTITRIGKMAWDIINNNWSR